MNWKAETQTGMGMRTHNWDSGETAVARTVDILNVVTLDLFS